MIIRQAHLADKLKLSQFYSEFPLKGWVDIKLNRFDDFYAPLQIQSENHRTYILEDNNKIEGMATFVIKDLLLNDKVRPVAFGRDLRISNNRRAVVEWSQHFLPAMREVQHDYGVKYIFSILSGSEIQAANAFIRPRSMKRPLPHYHLYRRFNLCSLHGRLPWAKNPLPHLKIVKGSPQLEDALIYYIVQKSLQKDLASSLDTESFADKIARWKNLEISDFLIALDKHDNIVGCVAPWASYGIQEYIPLTYSLVAHNFRQFLKFGHLLSWTRPLTKPSWRLQKEEPLKFKFMCFLNADNEDIFESLLWAAYDQASSDEFLVYVQTRTEYIYRRPLSWIGSQAPYSVFLLNPPDWEIPSFMRPTNEKAIEMEPFFI